MLTAAALLARKPVQACLVIKIWHSAHVEGGGPLVEVFERGDHARTPLPTPHKAPSCPPVLQLRAGAAAGAACAGMAADAPPQRGGVMDWLGWNNAAPPVPEKRGAGLLLRRANGDCLLLLRRSEHNDNTWGLPGGNADASDGAHRRSRPRAPAASRLTPHAPRCSRPAQHGGARGHGGDGPAAAAVQLAALPDEARQGACARARGRPEGTRAAG